MFLDVKECLYVPEYSRNLEPMNKWDAISFKFMVGDDMFSLYRNKYYYGSSILIDGLFNVEHVVSNKCSIHNDWSSFLWLNSWVTYPKKGL
jgi:hypothetical protein